MIDDVNDGLIDNEYSNLLLRINEILDDQTVIDVPSNVKYLSDMWNDLPHNAYINKGITGCGGTTLAITNDQNYVIAVHSTNIIINKSNQHKNLCPVYGEVDDKYILDYIENANIPIKKFMVTYDSVPRLLNIINEVDYRLLVDESHVLIRYLGEFKTSVCHALIESTYKFKSASFLTATPTERSYLPSPMKQLSYIQLNWQSLCKPEIKHTYCGNQIQTKVVSFINDKLDNTDDEIYVFYNSRAGVSTTIKKLLIIRSELTINDINIVFANTQPNIDYFKKSLKTIDIGTKLEVDENGKPLKGHNKRINFISSFGFEGVDFYTFGKDVTTLVVADSASKSMRYDISIDMPQILGRFRRDKDSGLFPRNDIYFIWKTIQSEFSKSFDDILRFIARQIVIGKRLLSLDILTENDDETIDRLNTSLYSSWDPYIIPIDNTVKSKDKRYTINTYAMESILSVYYTLNIEYLSICNNSADTQFVVDSLKELASDLSTFDIPSLSTSNSAKLNRNVPFTKVAKEYYDLHLQLNDPFCTDRESIKESMESLLELSDTLSEYIKCINIESIKSKDYREPVIRELYNIHMLKDKIHLYGFIPGKKILMSDLQHILTSMYTDASITKAPKYTVLLNWMDIRFNKIIKGEKYAEVISLK